MLLLDESNRGSVANFECAGQNHSVVFERGRYTDGYESECSVLDLLEGLVGYKDRAARDCKSAH